jgi:hypothetical protein
MARADSVTVSIAALTTGIFSSILRERRVFMSIFDKLTLEARGTRRISSNVIPSPIIFSDMHPP